MIKFILILFSVVSLNMIVSFQTTSPNQSQDVDIEFSQTAIAIESGQPVFMEGTKIWLNNPKKESIQLYLNEEEKALSEEMVDLSAITDLKAGTYTLVVNTSAEEKIFGFTIQ